MLEQKITQERTIDKIEYWRERATQAERKLEALEYVIAYANDIVEMWPTVTLRTLWRVTDKIASLKEALKQAR